MIRLSYGVTSKIPVLTPPPNVRIKKHSQSPLPRLGLTVAWAYCTCIKTKIEYNQPPETHISIRTIS